VVERWRFSDAPQDAPEFAVPLFDRTLAEYVNTLIAAGFVLERIEEPRPSEEYCLAHPSQRGWRDHVALFLCFRATKPLTASDCLGESAERSSAPRGARRRSPTPHLVALPTNPGWPSARARPALPRRTALAGLQEDRRAPGERITTRLASHARRQDVSAETLASASRTDWPG
jgi:hypothetical protein